MGIHALLQGIFPTQGPNPHLSFLHWQVGSLPLAPPGKLTKVSRCIHVSKNGTVLFLFNNQVLLHCIYVTDFPYP